MAYSRRPTGPVGWIISGVIFLAAIIGYFVLDGYEEEMLEEQLRTEAETRGPIWVDESSTEIPDENIKGGGISKPADGSYLSLADDVFSPGEEIVVFCYNDESFDSTAWIGLIPSEIPHGSESENDMHDLDYEYLSGESGEYTFTAPDKSGDYDFRLHDSDGGGKEVDSISFTVR